VVVVVGGDCFGSCRKLVLVVGGELEVEGRSLAF